MLPAEYQHIRIGFLPHGRRNQITDVSGVTVGHSTIETEEFQTGVTVVMPSEDNIYLNKMTAACYVLNGFGKTLGTIQIDEIGTLESPIAFTSTLNVGLVHDALVGYMADELRKTGRRLCTYNPVVCETNDCGLSHSYLRPVKESHVREAIASASSDFAEGAVGAGAGTTCHGVKGGIGSSSRLVEISGKTYTVGILVQSNYGDLGDLRVDGRPVGHELTAAHADGNGSIIILLATDAPLTDSQLRRVIKRAGVGLARIGSFIDIHSGDVFLGFSTANRFSDPPTEALHTVQVLDESTLGGLFRAAAEATEEAILSSLLHAHTVKGRQCLVDRLKDAGLSL